jgi:hypothetical protein
MGVSELFDLSKGGIAHFVMSFLVFVATIVMAVVLGYTRSPPAFPTGWTTHDYDADKGKRKALSDYLTAKSLPDTTPMNQFSVATASFGGIYTEDMGLNPWIGVVSPDAARLQVEAGARAIILDTWPDPNTRAPVVCSMRDVREWYTHRNWMNLGLDKGVGRYSNWDKMTRNTAPISSIIESVMQAAFSNSPGTQNDDPFFLILRLHGAMTTSYLDNLGNIILNAIKDKTMGPQWNRCTNQKAICSTPVSEFKSKVFLIVLPDIQPTYNILPNINTYAAFTAAYLPTQLGAITNALEQNPSTMFFEPSGISVVSAASQPACNSTSAVATPPQSLAQTGFCIIQGTTGGASTMNKHFFGQQQSYDKCLQSGAQFVGVNLFSPDKSDSTLTAFFDADHFGTYSFRKI